MAVALLLSSLIGLALGLLGGGGSILTLPILVYALGVEPKAAIAMSLIVVGITSISAIFGHLRAGNVHFRTGLVFGLASMFGAFGGGRLAAFFPPKLLLVSFAALMLVTATAMLRGRREGGPRPVTPALSLMLLQGLFVGALTGLVGAGGGFLLVPALTLLGGLSMRAAIGTSLFVIALNSAAGAAGQLGHVHINFTLTLLVAGAAVLGSQVGARLANRVPQALLRRVFAWFVLAMGAYIVVRELKLLALVTAQPLVYGPVLVLAFGALGGLALLLSQRPQGVEGQS